MGSRAITSIQNTYLNLSYTKGKLSSLKEVIKYLKLGSKKYVNNQYIKKTNFLKFNSLVLDNINLFFDGQSENILKE